MKVGLKETCLFGAIALSFTACTGQPVENKGSETKAQNAEAPLVIGAIPDQDPEKVQRLSGKLVAYLKTEFQVPVTFQPVTDYAAAVTAFKVGDLDLVWFGGLTGVQARLQVKDAQAIAQRDIDEKFQSVFIANAKSGLKLFKETNQLTTLKNHTFTFGSESSTSGRLMPQYFIQEAGMTLDDFKGKVGFSSNHDATLKLVEAGTYDAGALNSQVWDSRVKEGDVDQKKVTVLWRTPPYYDYHWVVRPDVETRYGAGFTKKLQTALTSLNPEVPEQKEILELFGAEKFIPTENKNYAQIEKIGRQIGKIQ
ncbi:MAG: putative selenate ABC transporter substrate-binding protein [Thermosynechococcaceae cyanobacterium]